MKDTIRVHIADTLIKTYYTGNTFQFIKKSTIKRVKVTQVLCSAALRTLNTLLSHNVAAGMSPKTWKNMFALPVPSSQSQWGCFFFLSVAKCSHVVFGLFQFLCSSLFFLTSFVFLFTPCSSVQQSWRQQGHNGCFKQDSTLKTHAGKYLGQN